MRPEALLATIETVSLRAGTLIAGAYRVLRPIAEGGMGVIYEVEQAATGARRALKVMHGRFAADENLRIRFVREARLAASIPTDHVAQVLDAGVDPSTGALFIVMELLEGTTLSQELRRRGPFAWSDTLAILGQVAHALGAAHTLGIVHRDLKPANVFLGESRHATVSFMVKLLDFGIAKAVAASSEATAVALGTPTWMAPEQTSIEAPIGPEADVWSFGLLAFMMLVGRHYFATANMKSVSTAAVFREIVFDPLIPASERATQVGFADRLPHGFDGWFARCVDRVPAQRFAEAHAAFNALALLPAPTPKETPTPSETKLRALSAISVETPITAIETPHPSRIGRSRVSTDASVKMSTAGADTRVRRRSVGAFLAGGSIVGAIGVGLAMWLARGKDVRPVAPTPATAPLVAPELRLHGSNTIGAELGPALAEAFLQRRTAAKAVVRKRTGPNEVSVEARDADKTIESIEIFAHGTRTAFEDLGARCDLGMASSRIHEDEASKLASLGDLRSAASENVIGLDGIAVIVNPTNAISTLTRTQVGDLFAGKVRRWSLLGGKDEPVVVHARDGQSGTYDSFKHLVIPDRPLVADAVRHESSEELSDAVAGDARAVGFIGLPYVRSAKAVMVQDSETVPLLLPSPMTVSTEDYTLARRLYLYLPANASVVARDFVDFVLSDDGQRVVRAAGFVSLLPDCDPIPSPCAGCPREYVESVRGACRISLDFRFEDASLQLDTRGLRDLLRVVKMLERPKYAGRGIVLLGFSDATGSPGDNLSLSQQRAHIVAQQLRARGLHVFLERGLGSEVPIADDSTEAGRGRNRRVEAWLR